LEIKNKKILFLVVSSKTHVHGNILNIDRVDLTRRMDAINTWVGDALYKGHDVVFLEGGSENVWYDDNSKTLHLNVSDEYENSELSNLLSKAKAGLRWSLENKDFDILYLCDDDVYVNLEQFLKIEMTHDCMCSGSLGGGGFFLNKKSIQTILNFENEGFRVADQAIYNSIRDDNTITKNFHQNKSAAFYVPGELYATIHYVTGKRSYYLHNIFRFFNENGYTNRKIILGGPVNSIKLNEVVSYESTLGRKTPRWYDFVIDPNGWEYHGGYARSLVVYNNLIDFWPYAENATKFFVVNIETMFNDYIGTPYFNTNLNKLITLCENSLIDKNNILLCSSKEETIDGWVLDNSVKESHKLNFEHLNDYNFYRKAT
jgi:hypothetical protein